MTNLKTAVSIAGVAMGLSLALTASAGPHADALTRCLADSTTGKDRKELARWVFTVMSAHPEIRDISAVTPQVRDQMSKTVADLFMSLVTEKCLPQTRAAIQNEGPSAMQAAFTVLGQLAMQELTANPEVTRAFSVFERFMDKEKFSAAISKK